MKGFIKGGAVVVLLLIAAPILLAVSRNPFLVLPVWMGVSYLGATRLLPPERRSLATAVAIICGALAWRLAQAFVTDLPEWLIVAFVSQAVVLAWLMSTGSRWAAALQIALQLAVLAPLLLRLPQLAELWRVQNIVDLIPSALGMIVCPAAAILLLAPRLKGARRTGRLAAIFD